MERYKTKQGFTIIEVVLVLAIAGLIFLMVFVAFPALQRNQRDAQRRQDIANFSSNLKNARANGIIITDLLSTAGTNSATLPSASRQSNCNTNNSKTIGTLNTYINGNPNNVNRLACKMLRYYTNNMSTDTSDSATESNQFADPDGQPYTLLLRNKLAQTTASYATMTGAFGYEDDDGNKNHTIVLIFNTECSNDSGSVGGIKSKVDSNSYTIRYAMEDGSIYCQNGSL